MEHSVPERALAAHRNARYIAEAMGFTYDPETGTATVDSTGELLSGTVGEIFTDRRFYVPQVSDEADRIDVAFELGFLIAKQGKQHG